MVVVVVVVGVVVAVVVNPRPEGTARRFIYVNVGTRHEHVFSMIFVLFLSSLFHHSLHNS